MKKYKVAWIVPNFIEGSGGHRTIFQNVQFLIEKGFECHVYVENDGSRKNAKVLANDVNRLFGKCNAKFYLGFDIKDEYDIVFATAWYTAKIVRDIRSKAKKMYFIQDFEALFNPMGDGYILASNSYCYGLQPITIGKWLSRKMKDDYNLNSQYFDFCADTNVYKKIKSIEKEKAVCFIYQPEKPRRCSLIGIEALGIVKHLRPDIEIYLYGSSETRNIWFEHKNLGIIDINKCNELYNKCQVGLCISSSNPSRIPFEMMAAGLPVVDLHMENNLYDMPQGGVLLAHQTPESIAKAIIKIVDDNQLQRRMSEFGVKYMQNKSLEYGFEQFYNAVKNIIDDKDLKNEAPEKIYNECAIMADEYINIQQNDNMNYEKKLRLNNSRLERIKNIKLINKSRTIRWIWKLVKKI